MVKPIETVYKGYRFRSRLEARWAVFFDAIKAKWLYEPEGFRSESGECYLPDFYLPEIDTYVEVKPYCEGRQEEIDKALRFIQYGGKIKRLLLLPDIPPYRTDNSVYWYMCAHFDSLSDEVLIERAALISESDFPSGCSHSLYIDSNYNARKQDFAVYGMEFDWSALHDSAIDFDTLELDGRKIKMEGYDGFPTISLDEAYKKARQARFEHGETPT